MRTKEEITKKRSKSSGQLDLPNTVSSTDKVKHKRRWLYLALFITTGLSLFFWFYRSFRSFNFSKSISRINFNLTRSTPDHLTISSQLSTFLSKHSGIVGFYLSHDHPLGNFIYGQISDLNLNIFKTALTSQSAEKMSPNASLLPEGVVYREYITAANDQIIFSSLISNPLDQIFIIIRFSGSLDSLKAIIPNLVSTAYWSVSSN